LPGPPFAAITTLDGRYVFVSIGAPATAIAVIRQKKIFAFPVHMVATCGPAFGLAMSKGGRYLLVAVQKGASCPSGGVQFIDVQKAIAGDPSAAMGTVPTDPSAIEVAISPDNKLVFVANEFSAAQNVCDNPDTVSVIDFHKALSSGQSERSVIGTIPVTVRRWDWPSPPTAVSSTSPMRWRYRPDPFTIQPNAISRMKLRSAPLQNTRVPGEH
jgi:DNA-binding beta-propeller fold protein YncE